MIPCLITGAAIRAAGTQTVADFWRIVTHAVPTAQTPIFPDSTVRQHLFREGPLVAETSYLENAHLIDETVPPNDKDAHARQLYFCKKVLLEALESAKIDQPMRKQTGLVLATSWSDGSLYESHANSHATTSERLKAYDPASAIDAIASEGSLGGPRLTIDCACASSLYGLDAALGLITQGAVDRVIVMGANAYLPPFLFPGFSGLRALSRTGRLRPYLVDADGIVPGEGVCAIVIEREDVAVSRHILGWARIIGVGLSSDGNLGSHFSPSLDGQLLAYRRAYKQIDPGSIAALEGHGTGTPVGDKTELGAINAFFGPHFSHQRPLALGSSKALFGHTLAAAGALSLLKTALMLKSRLIPRHISGKASTEIGNLVCLPQEHQEYRQTIPMRIGVTALGFGGANAHIVMEECSNQSTQAIRARNRIEGLKLAEASRHTWKINLRGGQLIQGSHGLPSRGLASPGEASVGGRFLAGTFTVDSANVRMGPKQASRMDPYQLLAADLAGIVWQQYDHQCPHATMSLSVNNSAGSMAFIMSKKFTMKGRGKDVAEFPKLSSETILSTLPSMMSALPTAAHDLRGGHLTIGGNSTALAATLLLIPWYQNKEDADILLGGGYYQASQCGKLPTDPTEGYGVLSCTVGRRDDSMQGQQLLVELLPREQGSKHDILPLVAASFVEASGLDTIIEHLRSSSTQTAWLLPFDQHQDLKLTLLNPSGIAADIESTNSQPAPKLPVTVNLGNCRTDKKPDTDLYPKNADYETRFHSYSKNESPAKQTRAGTTQLSIARRWIEGVSETVLKYLETNHVAGGASPNVISRSEANTAITSIERLDNRVKAQLLCDLNHPYFFDHPLDHIPGIYVVEGMLQLWEANSPQHDRYISELTMHFHKFAELDRPVMLELERQNADTLIGIVRQSEYVVCQFSLRESLTVSKKVPDCHNAKGGAPRSKIEDPVQHQRFLHKHRQENVLIAPPYATQGKRIFCDLLPSPEGHIFHEGPASWHSPLYLLEASRQLFTFYAHTNRGIPLGVPMILGKVHVVQKQPIERDFTIELEGSEERMIAIGSEEFHADFRVDWRCGNAILGSVSMSCRSMSDEKYEAIRHDAKLHR